MGFFSWNKPRVSHFEWKKVRSSLFSKGWSTPDLNRAEAAFRGDLHEHQSSEGGIDRREIEGGIKWMRENKVKHGLSDNQISELGEHLHKHL